MTISTVLAGTQGMTKAGVGPLILTGANTYTGATTISAGTLTLGGASGTINGSSSLSVFGTLALDNTAGNADRIGDSTTVTLNSGGAITLNQNATTNSTENVGTLTLGFGESTITVSSAASRVTTFNASAISRTNGSTLLVRGSTLGSQATNVGRVTLGSTGGLTLIGTNTASNGTGSGTVTNLKIVPWIVADTSASGIGTNFATYDTTSGLRPLGTNETVTLATQTGSDQNLKDASASGTTLNLTNSVTQTLWLSRSLNWYLQWHHWRHVE